LHLLASSGRYTHLDGEGHRRVPFGCYKIGCVAAGDNPGFFTNEVTEDPRVHNHAWARELGLVGFAGNRILTANGEPRGVIAFFSKKAIPADDIAFLECLASTVGLVVWADEAQQAFRTREKSLQTIMDSLSLGSILLDPATRRIVELNQTAAAILGLPVESIVGSLGQMYFDFAHTDLNLVREGHPLYCREIPLKRSDGSTVSVMMTVMQTERYGQTFLMMNFMDVNVLSQAAAFQ
jgi:PAS domain-containing protein